MENQALSDELILMDLKNPNINDEAVIKFMSINFPDRDMYDMELIRDCIMISRLYDRNFLRLTYARRNHNNVNIQRFNRIEKILETLSAAMKDVSGIRLFAKKGKDSSIRNRLLIVPRPQRKNRRVQE